MRYESVLKAIGGFGLYQFLAFNLLASSSMKSGIDFVGLVLHSAPIPHMCAAAGGWNNSGGGLPKVNWTQLPKNASQCDVLVKDKHGDDVEVKCSKWVYDKSQFTNSPVIQYDLVCGNSYWTATIQFFYMLGSFLAYALLGPIGDKLGRKMLVLILAVIDIIATLGMSFMPEIYGYTVFRFFSAMHLALDMAGIVLVQEIVLVRHRDITGILVWMYWVTGYCGMAGLGYAIRDWRTLQLVILFPCILYIPIIFVIVESPRWLTLKGRTEDSQASLRKIARINRVEVEDNFFDNIDEVKVPTGRFVDLLRGKNTRIKTFISVFAMIASGLTYWGIALDATFALESPYLNIFFMGLVEAPAYVLSWFICSRLGRRWCAGGGSIIAGVLVLIVTHIPKDGWLFWLRTSVALLGKLFATAVFAAMILYVAELYPTSTRTIGAFVGHSASSLGSMVAPYLNYMGRLVYFLPSLVFAVFTLVAAALILIFLPETKGAALPQTFEEAEAFVRGKEYVLRERLDSSIREHEKISDTSVINNKYINS